jgi:hypothetical protein
MDGRNGSDKVVLYVRIPPPLNWLVEDYQASRQIASKNQAIIELLETHPEIARRARALYTQEESSPHPER